MSKDTEGALVSHWASVASLAGRWRADIFDQVHWATGHLRRNLKSAHILLHYFKSSTNLERNSDFPVNNNTTTTCNNKRHIWAMQPSGSNYRIANIVFLICGQILITIVLSKNRHRQPQYGKIKQITIISLLPFFFFWFFGWWTLVKSKQLNIQQTELFRWQTKSSHSAALSWDNKG